MRRGPISLARRLVVAGLLLSAAGATGESLRVERRWPLMGTVAQLEVEAPTRSEGLAAGERALAALRATEARLSTWRDDSELSRLNRSPVGGVTAISAELARDLELATECHRSTGGAFSPFLGALVSSWGLRGGGSLPEPARLATALEASHARMFHLSEGAASRLHPLAALEEGAFGKGRALDAAVEALASTPVRGGWIDLGGQVAVFGGAEREILVAGPDADRVPVYRLVVDRGSVATSGNGERRIDLGRERLSHILDPRTGRPARDFGSMTVWAPTATAADCLATGLFVLGPEAGVRWAAEHPEAEVLALAIEDREDGLLARASCGLRGRLQPLAGAGTRLWFDCGPVDGAALSLPTDTGSTNG